MWRTSRGDRTLRGDEAALVGTSIESMIDNLLIHVDELSDDDDDEVDLPIDCESGIAVYDALTVMRRIALLHDVARHLLTDTDQVLDLSAELEACVAAIFVEIRDQVAIEIEFPSLIGNSQSPSWRTLVRNAYENMFANQDRELGDDWELPSPESGDIRSWAYLIDSLSDAILWDRDFELAESFLDDDPGVSDRRRRLLGIDDEYFTRIAPDPRPDQLYRLVWQTQKIVRAKPR